MKIFSCVDFLTILALTSAISAERESPLATRIVGLSRSASSVMGAESDARKAIPGAATLRRPLIATIAASLTAVATTGAAALTASSNASTALAPVTAIPASIESIRPRVFGRNFHAQVRARPARVHHVNVIAGMTMGSVNL